MYRVQEHILRAAAGGPGRMPVMCTIQSIARAASPFVLGCAEAFLLISPSPPGLASPVRGVGPPLASLLPGAGGPLFPLFSFVFSPSWYSRARVKESYCLWTVWLKPLIGEFEPSVLESLQKRLFRKQGLRTPLTRTTKLVSVVAERSTLRGSKR